MRGTRVSIFLTSALSIFAVILFAIRASATQESVIYAFNDTDGSSFLSGVVMDAAGNLYGTTAYGGDGAFGTAFELTPQAGGGWAESNLHVFKNDGKDGINPYAGLVFDAMGNLYGTTRSGGNQGGGTVFELTPQKVGGGWTESVIYSFKSDGKDGVGPYAGVVFDKAGNLYGTTWGGGADGEGTVFELTPHGAGTWTESVLYSFKRNVADGRMPQAQLILDAAGNLYGTTTQGGKYSSGTVFELLPKAGGGWTEKRLHIFIPNDKDGVFAATGLIFDAVGNLYGTTLMGGVYRNGTAFELMPQAGGGWKEKTLHSFKHFDGINPETSLTFDTAGNLYGATDTGGSHNVGVVFELTPKAGGGWAEKTLYSFKRTNDARGPQGNLIFDTAGNLYGTAGGEVDPSAGTVYEITP